jgi:hypothetical protein
MADPPLVLGKEEKAALVASGVQKVSIVLIFVAVDSNSFALQIATSTHGSFRSSTVEMQGHQPPRENC